MPVFAFSLLGFLVMGYHPGLEDDGVYLSAVKAGLNPSLYPHNSQFFRLQMQATLFDTGVAQFVRWTRIPVAWSELLWQLASLFVILWATKKIAELIFAERRAHWGAMAMVAAMLTLPVAGTALNIADQHLHPRNLATALILAAVAQMLGAKRWQALPLLILAFAMHPIMAALGASFCAFLGLAMLEPARSWVRATEQSFLAAAPLGWIFEPSSTAWRQALDSRTYFLLNRWTWYEWLGALAPLFLFWLLWRMAGNRGEIRLARFALAVLAYGVFQQIVAVAMLTPESLIRLAPLQPMRYLQLIYLFMALVAGGLLGRYLLKDRWWRWAIYLLAINGSMFLTQWEFVDLGAHLELPGISPANPWEQAFEWVRSNTPLDAYFALDPNYMAAPDEGFRSFRALAERSQLADGIKDTAVVTQVPSLAPLWQDQLQAQANWQDFSVADFERLKTDFGVNWVLVDYPQPAGLRCAWHNRRVAVCPLP